MEPQLTGMDERLQSVSEELSALRRFAGPPKDFWPRLLAAAAGIAQADLAVLMLGRPGQTPRWTKIGEWSAGTGQMRLRKDFHAFVDQAAERGLAETTFLEENDEATGAFTLGVRMRMLKPEDELILVAQVVDFTEGAARESVVRLALASDTPALYQAHMASRQAQSDVEKLATVLDLQVPVNAEKRLLAAALALCNGVATRLQCERVSLGWMDHGYIRLLAISRTEKFDRQMEAAQSLEKTMEECADQDEEVLWPAVEGTTVVTRDHAKFASEQKVAHLCTVPLRQDAKVVGVLACERQSHPFTAVEMQQMRLLCDQITPRMADLRRHDRWFGAQWAVSARELLAKSLGPEHTWAKVAAIAGAVSLLALFLVRVPYRVEGKFIVRSEAVSYLTAPFEGYVETVSVRPGDYLTKGAPIVALNRTELLLEQSSAMAEIGRYEREGEKARATKQLAEMRIAEALRQQSQARLELINYRLENAVIRAPFDGVVVEGDLRERIAAPVKVGEALYKVARLDGLFIEAEVDERDVREILRSSEGEFAFVSQPKRTFAATVAGIEAAAMAKKEANVFLVRLKPDTAAEPWWRPGMTGITKIRVENRTLWWIFTHRTADFLRLKLWW